MVFFLFFVMIFSKIVFVNFIRESIVAFLIKHYGLLQCFPTWYFFYIYFLKNCLCQFLFNITITSKAKSCGESTITFLIKHCGLLPCFPLGFFFFNEFFSKLSLSILFYFNIELVENLAL
jgi:hypothetical protein